MPMNKIVRNALTQDQALSPALPSCHTCMFFSMHLGTSELLSPPQQMLVLYAHSLSPVLIDLQLKS